MWKAEPKDPTSQWTVPAVNLNKIWFGCCDSLWIKMSICRNLLFHIPLWPVSHFDIKSSDLVFDFTFRFLQGLLFAFWCRKELDGMSCVRRDYFLWLKCGPPACRLFPRREAQYSLAAPQNACSNMKQSQMWAVSKLCYPRLHLHLAPG